MNDAVTVTDEEGTTAATVRANCAARPRRYFYKQVYGEKQREAAREYYRTHKAECLERMKAYRQDPVHREAMNAATRRWRERQRAAKKGLLL